MTARHSTWACSGILVLRAAAGIIIAFGPERASQAHSQAVSTETDSPENSDAPTERDQDGAPPRSTGAAPLGAAERPRDARRAELSTVAESALAARVLELTLEVNRLRESSTALARERHAALANHDDATASRHFSTMMVVAAKRRELVATVIDTGFELSCVRVEGCNDAKREAILSSRQQIAHSMSEAGADSSIPEM